jgi:hypothetical protein
VGVGVGVCMCVIQRLPLTCVLQSENWKSTVPL